MTRAPIPAILIALSVACQLVWADATEPVQLGRRDAHVHDPSTMVKCGNEYWFFSTGRGIPSYRSKDLIKWESGPTIFSNAPAWVADAVPEKRGNGFWAPDIIHAGNQYLLYYSASTFGKKTSAIGLATNPTLDPDDS
jgi:arabinan endo-1,5-alpha-L-arabinosidase